MSTGGWVDVDERSPFSLDNLPFGIGEVGDATPHVYIAVGDAAVDLAVLADVGALDGCGAPPGCFGQPALNRFISAGRPAATAVRRRLQELLAGRSGAAPRGAVIDRSALRLHLPVSAGDYVDFYSSIHHARNLGRLFRPGSDPLPVNWRQLPVAYHGRSGTLVPSGAGVRRPSGLRMVDETLCFGPSLALDFELEVGFVIGTPNALGTPIPTSAAGDHIFGFCLVNDWSARDIQAYEYQPLGPFLGKSFGTSVSPWVVTLDALEPHRVPSPVQEPPVADYLRCQDPWGLALELEVLLQSPAMRASGTDPVVVTRTRFDDMYWTPAQQLAHATVNGAATRPGDLFASGTVSGPVHGSEGSLIELTSGGKHPIALPDGSSRGYLEDGDSVIMRGWAVGEGGARIGFGELTGTIVPGG
jgi:fumarylacetoacetase